MIDMIQQHILPACRTASVGPVAELSQAVTDLKAALGAVHHEDDGIQKVRYYYWLCCFQDL